MRRKIPSTNALLTFEAAGRHESFSRAAEELSTTEGAVSRQIARLEDFLGLLLFNRVKGRVHLTDRGRIYLDQIVGDLDRIESHTQRLQDPPRQGVLELAVIPTFTNRWIIPRLPKFFAKNPGITVNMTERSEPFLFGTSSIDAAIHCDSPAWAGMMKKHLFAENMVPACSPTLTGGRAELSLEMMRKLPRLHKRGHPGAWKKWWDGVGAADINPMEGAQYDLFSTGIEEACAGLGVVLVPRLYVAKEIESGALVIPHPYQLVGHSRYCAVFPVHKYGSWPLKPFLDWLIQESQQYVRQRDARENAARLIAGPPYAGNGVKTEQQVRHGTGREQERIVARAPRLLEGAVTAPTGLVGSIPASQGQA